MKTFNQDHFNSQELLIHWIDQAPGAFCVRDFGQMTMNETSMLLENLELLTRLGILDRHGERRGWYRKVESEPVELDFVNAMSQSVDIWLPFGLSDLVEIHPGNIIIIAGTPNSGKALRDNTPILTHTGWKDIKNTKIGDIIYGRSGALEKITGVHPQGLRKCYRFVFNDRSWIDSDENHLWSLMTAYQMHTKTTGRGNPNLQFNKWIEMTTIQIVDKYGLGIIPSAVKRPRFRGNAPIYFSKKKVPIPPYIMGLLLGDGCFSKNHMVSITTGDAEILDAFVSAGFDLSYSSIYQYRIKRLKPRIIKLGLNGKRAWEKSVPKIYLYNDVSSRLAILKGLMDSDGSVCKGGYTVEFCSTSEQLAKDVQFLIRSLGGRATIVESESYYTYKGEKLQGRNRFRVTIKINIKVFNLKRKRIRQRKFKKPLEKKLVEIRGIGYHKTACISTSAADGLFIAKDFTVTHNSALVYNIIKENRPKGWDVYLFNSESGAGELRKRLDKFDDITIDQWDFKAYQRSTDFHQVVRPGTNSLNIIDFLEVFDDFFKVGGHIKRIHDKLDGAIGIICLQKNPGADTGLGGYRMLEVTRLAIALEFGTVKILKAKNFRDPKRNPNGAYKNFKLIDGYKIIDRGNWERDKEILNI